ncbi:Imm30 family immunity protein [Domibacillus indicus]|uniref:Imm30 family immunity protein n=1 Tax=Domibacillus indicus TaxID=1437523 RepID=UPI000617F053|nr:Imm30 family immunity protein [Domibacillus indicus]
MKAEEAIHTLMNSRFMRTETEISLFEEALEAVYQANDYRLTEELTGVLEDDTEQEEVMWGVIHAIEALSARSPKEALARQIAAVPENLDKSRGWLSILHVRIVNHDEYRGLLAEVLREADTRIQEAVIGLFHDIQKENPGQFKEKAEQVTAILTKE